METLFNVFSSLTKDIVLKECPIETMKKKGNLCVHLAWAELQRA